MQGHTIKIRGLQVGYSIIWQGEVVDVAWFKFLDENRDRAAISVYPPVNGQSDFEVNCNQEITLSY